MSTNAPPAVRARPPGWRDPRIVVGVVIMAVSVLVGGWLLSSADDTVGIVVLRHGLPAGAQITLSDLGSRQVRFADDDMAARYLRAGQRLPSGAVLARPIGAGELLPRAAIRAGGDEPGLEVPLSVGRDDVPATVRPGSVVDVWVVPDGATRVGPDADSAHLVLEAVTVLDLGGQGDSLAPESKRQVIVSVPSSKADHLGQALGSVASGRLVLTRRG